MEPPRPLDLRATAHRPTPLPKGPPLLRFGWHGIAFLHWRVPPHEVHPHVPDGLTLDLHAGDAWVTAAAFHMVRMRMAGLPAALLPRVPELNLRTYVQGPNGPGALFWRLDAPDPLVVSGGRAAGIPYRRSRVQLDDDGVAVEPKGGPGFSAGWSVGDEVEPDALDAFLHERYVLYARDGRRALRTAAVHHLPWPLRGLEAWVEQAGALAAFAPGVAGRPPDRARWSVGVEAGSWAPRPVRRPTAVK